MTTPLRLYIIERRSRVSLLPNKFKVTKWVPLEDTAPFWNKQEAIDYVKSKLSFVNQMYRVTGWEKRYQSTSMESPNQAISGTVIGVSKKRIRFQSEVVGAPE